MKITKDIKITTFRKDFEEKELRYYKNAYDNLNFNEASVSKDFLCKLIGTALLNKIKLREEEKFSKKGTKLLFDLMVEVIVREYDIKTDLVIKINDYLEKASRKGHFRYDEDLMKDFEIKGNIFEYGFPASAILLSGCHDCKYNKNNNCINVKLREDLLKDIPKEQHKNIRIDVTHTNWCDL